MAAKRVEGNRRAGGLRTPRGHGESMGRYVIFPIRILIQLTYDVLLGICSEALHQGEIQDLVPCARALAVVLHHFSLNVVKRDR